MSRTFSVASRVWALSLRCSHPASSRFSRTVSDGNTPAPPGTIVTPRPAVSSGGV